jgi:O-antigen/teichoic acid export membrane protein
LVTTNASEAGSKALGHAQRSAAIVFAIRLAGAALNYGTQVLLARLMGNDAYGVFATTWVWILIVSHLTLFGLAQSICRLVPVYRVRDELHLARGLIVGGAMAALSLAAILALGGALLLWLTQSLLSPDYVLPFAIALMVLPVFTLQDYLEGLARSFNWMTLALGPPFMIRPLLIVLGMITATLLGAPPAAWVATASTLVAASVATAIQAGQLIPRIRAELGRGARGYRPREWLWATLPIAYGNVALMVLGFIDVLVLGFFVPAADVGIYFAATRIVQFVNFVRYAATAATAQRFSEICAEGEHKTMRALVRRAALLTSLASTAFGVGLLLGAPLLLALFGPGFRASYDVLALLVVGTVVQAAFGPAEDLLNMLGYAGTCAAISFWGLLAAVLLCLVLIPLFGILGASIAMALALSLRAAALSIAVSRNLGFATHVFA